MSFQEVRNPISICNRALDRISQQPITGTLDNPLTNAARACSRHYKAVVRSLLEKHHFGLATKRVGLVEVTNDRGGEWAVAYQPPTDMAFPVSLGPYAASSINYYWGVGALYASLLGGQRLFAYAGGVIYSQLPGAELEYVSFDITEADFNQTFEDLVVLFLASELAHPIAKDRQLGKDLKDEGKEHLNWAIASNLNTGQPTYGNRPSETELAREGLPIGYPFYGDIR